MPDYSNGKIYKIYCNITGETYYGSTCQPISVRMGTHRDRAKENTDTNYTSMSIINRGDYDYSLVENHNCNNKQELHARERHWIENHECVNKVVPGRTQKEWYQENREKEIERLKVYRQENKEKIAESRKEDVVCECGCEIRRRGLIPHRKSKKHQEFIQSLDSGGNTI